MRLLLDTHALLWWGHNDGRLSAKARAQIDEAVNERFVSAVSAMEITTKFRLGKLPDAELLARSFSDETLALGFGHLAITVQHGQMAGSLPIPHKDPFDRLLIAQAIIEGMTLVSNEVGFDAYGVSRLW